VKETASKEEGDAGKLSSGSAAADEGSLSFQKNA